MRYLTLTLSVLLALSSASADAQTGGTKKPEKRTITFESRPTGNGRGSGSSGSRYKRRPKVEYKKNSLTVGVITPLLHGYLPLYYERAVSGKLSLQVGAGLTFRSRSNDLGEKSFPHSGSEFGNNSYYYTNVENDYADYTYRNSSPGYMVSFSPRFYPGDDNLMNGFYIAPVLAYKVFRFNVQKADESAEADFAYSDNEIPRVSETVDEKFVCTDLLFQLGGHHQTESHMVIGWSFAAGIRMDKSTRLDVDYDNSTSDLRYTNTVRQYESTRPVLELNLSFGYAF